MSGTKSRHIFIDWLYKMSHDMIVSDGEITRYYRDGVLHRDNDQPAVVYSDGSQEWWVHGKRLRWDPRSPTEIRCNPATKNYEVSGSRVWHNTDGQIHREDEPAVIHANGTREWWQNGQRYRKNGLPTVETAEGRRMWHNRQGQLHRLGLPAVIGPNGPEWWFNGEQQELPW